MLKISKLHVEVDNKKIINNISLVVNSGEVHAFMGPNGSGKTTFAKTLIGDPCCVITEGSIFFDQKNITNLLPDERARKGIFLAFQYPCSIPGLTIFSFLKEAYTAIKNKIVDVIEFREIIYKKADILGIDHSYLFRDLNEGFSGGEKKRLEMLQLLLFKPKLAIIDEIDSGLDIDSLKIVFDALNYSQKENPDMAVILITHYSKIIRNVNPNKIHVFSDGEIVCSGDIELVEKIEKDGYDFFKK